MSGELVEQKIIFFDGVCNLCNGFVDFVVQNDPAAVFKFASLQGKTAAHMLPDHASRTELKSIVFIENGKVLAGAAAVFAIFKLIPRYGVVGRLGAFVPSFIADCVYNLVATNRYKIFGKKDTCRIPTAAERARFLD